MRQLRTTAIIALLVAWSALPILACALPAQPMSAEEVRCCKRMAGNCSAMRSMSGSNDMAGMEGMRPADGMSASHSCCKSQVSAGSSALPGQTTRHSSAQKFVSASWNSGVATPAFSLAAAYDAPGHPPPLLPVPTSILRI